MAKKAKYTSLTQLGAKSELPAEPTVQTLERVPNPHPGDSYLVRFTAPEFTCLCPVTGQPDFATITLRYVPDKLCVEMKSLKLYLQSYRNKEVFYEAAVNAILDDLVATLKPRRMTVVGEFNVRGGTAATVTAMHS